MKTQAAAAGSDLILVHFRQRRAHGRGEYLDNVAYHLMRMILDEGELGSLESLIEFCGTPNNLRRWLPTEADRIVFSDSLVQGLREMALDSACNLSSKSEETPLNAVTRPSVQRARRTGS